MGERYESFYTLDLSEFPKYVFENLDKFRELLA